LTGHDSGIDHFAKGFQKLDARVMQVPDGANINGTSVGLSLTLGDQNSPSQRWGRASFDRTQRFIISSTWSIPSPRQGLGGSIFGGWAVGVIAAIQSAVLSRLLTQIPRMSSESVKIARN
jgi:hypothetical protein